jgi:hypothetical protein
MTLASKSALLAAAATVVLVACGDGTDVNPGQSSGGSASGSSSSAGVPGAAGVSTAGTSTTTGGVASAGAAGSPTAGGSTGAGTGGQPAGGTAAGGTAAGGTAAGAPMGGSGGSSGSGGSGGAPDCTPIDPNATPEAKKLLCYIYSIYGKSVLSGQQETSWSNPQADIDYYMSTVGKHPAILGGDFLYQEGAKPGGNTTKRAIAYWQAGGITMMRYHMGAPPLADTYDNSKGTVANFDNLTTENTAENNSLKSKLDYMAGELKVLQDAKVPVILVPYHEVDVGAWFWWSKCKGPQFVKLWKYSVDYINKTKGIHNVLWVMGFGHDGAMADYNPAGYTDLGGIDQYDKGKQPFVQQWASSKAVFGAKVPIPLHETGTIPQPSAMFPSTAPWVLWNVWAGYQNTNAEGYTWNTPESIKMAYADAHTVTRETLPSMK